LPVEKVSCKFQGARCKIKRQVAKHPHLNPPPSRGRRYIELILHIKGEEIK